MSDKQDRIDLDSKGNLDDVEISDVEMFRLEYMDNNSVWIRLIRPEGKRDVVIWLNARGKIKGTAEYD